MTEFQCGEERATDVSFKSKADCDVYFATHPELHFHRLCNPQNGSSMFPAPAAFCVPAKHSYESIPPSEAQ